MARLDPTIPGSVATFMAFSRERSLRICAISASLAYTMTSVRMPRASSRGMRCRNASMVSSERTRIRISNVQVHLGYPQPAAPLDLQLVIRHGLHNQARAVACSVARFTHTHGLDGRLSKLRHPKIPEGDALPIEPVEHLVQPIHQQRFAVAALDRQRVLSLGLDRARVGGNRKHGQRGMREQVGKRAAKRAEADIRRMLQHLEIAGAHVPMLN